jgi:benzodiazapine receptor
MFMTGKKIVQLIICMLIPLLTGIIAGFITRNEMVNSGWFDLLNKPSFNPPDAVFGPVWTILYLLMGISLYMIWNSAATDHRKKALFIFGLQLFLNFCWSILFFYLHMVFGSVINILVLWICIIWMIIAFKKIKPVAGYLQLPYLAWVSFASVLDISIFIINN